MSDKLVSSQMRDLVKETSDNLLSARIIAPSPGDQLIYVPQHILEMQEAPWLEPDLWGYPNFIQPGFAYHSTDDDVFMRYWQWDDENRLWKAEMRTKANSELTPKTNLFYLQLFEERTSQLMLKEIYKERSIDA